MPLQSYGVLKAKILDRRHATLKSQHYQLLCGVGNIRWRVTINSQSDVAPSEVAYAAFNATRHPLITALDKRNEGWHPLKPREGLDYIRGGLCRPEHFRPLPLTRPGANNDLNELFDLHLRRGERVYVFGEPWGPDDERDPYFGFDPGRGIHDVHQNQGNSRNFRHDNGVWQDGGLIVSRPDGWTAILLRFQSQAWKTDNTSGHGQS